MSNSLKDMVGKRLTKNTKFMNENITITKLSVSEVLEIQNAAKEAGEDEAANFDVLKKVIRIAAEGGEDLTDEDFDQFPIDDLSKLSTEIMKHSGMGEAGKAK